MMEIMGRYIIFTADDEMPDCLMCDHCDDDCDCSKFCGAEYGWAGYKRTEWVDKK